MQIEDALNPSLPREQPSFWPPFPSSTPLWSWERVTLSRRLLPCDERHPAEDCLEELVSFDVHWLFTAEMVSGVGPQMRCHQDIPFAVDQYFGVSVFIYLLAAAAKSSLSSLKVLSKILHASLI